MRGGSDFINMLVTHDSSDVPMTSVHSHDDNIIVPCQSSRYERGRNVELGGVGHIGLSFSRTVQQIVLQEIQATTRSEGYPPD